MNFLPWSLNKNLFSSFLVKSFYSLPRFELFLSLVLIFIKNFLISISNLEFNYIYEVSFYDTGSMMAFLICLEHLYVCYYLIIILALVYWALYICVLDFSGWSMKEKGFFSFFFSYFSNLNINFLKIYFSFTKFLLSNLLKIKEIELLIFLYYTHINFSADSSIPLRVLGLIPFHFKKAYLNNKNIVNVFINFMNHFDLLGRSYIILNASILKYLSFINLLLDLISIFNSKNLTFNNLEELLLRKKFSKLLYYSMPNSYYFFNVSKMYLNLKKNNSSKLYFNNFLINLRSIYTDIFVTNNFKHSGLFEGVWAAFPTAIIICILIPSLILLYSFEDILNPYITVKVIGNQWYWTYEFNNYVNFESSSEKVTKPIYYSFNSNILLNDDLTFGTKRLLEVDNRLVLPTNVTTRFLVTSADVLHAFAVPELGFKVDAVPGRLNQILLFISRPGVYYGQCSELCGASHGFMPIVIQSVLPEVYSTYISAISEASDI